MKKTINLRKTANIMAVTVIIFMVSYVILNTLYTFNIIKFKKYQNKDFGFKTFVSVLDSDGDGINDQADILKSLKDYLKTKPKYKSKYYASGYPSDDFGTCVDIVGFALKGAGYDLMELVNEDIINNKKDYNLDKVDKKIDFRRTKNLNIYFKNNFKSLTLDTSKFESFQGGDIIVYKDHIAIVSENRTKNGRPYIYHHANKHQIKYEEDKIDYKNLIGHYRVVK